MSSQISKDELEAEFDGNSQKEDDDDELFGKLKSILHSAFKKYVYSEEGEGKLLVQPR